MCLGGNAWAHPHVYVDGRTTFIFNDAGQLDGMRISWTYDPFTTLVYFETLNLDTDGDGLLNDADRAAVIDGETNWPPDYKGDIYLEVAGQDYPLGQPQDAAVTFENNQVEVSFFLPLSAPIDITRARIILRLYDPFFYYAYTILPNAEPQELPSSCRANIKSFRPDAATSLLQEQLSALSREECG